MSPRRLVVLPALAAAVFSAAVAAAAPTITPSTLQCDGVTYQSGGFTHTPNPSIQVTVQDATGLRIGQATMGVDGHGIDQQALWRFDSGRHRRAHLRGCSGACAGNACLTYTYTYNDARRLQHHARRQLRRTTAAPITAGTAVATRLNSAKSLVPSGCPPPAPAVRAAARGDPRHSIFHGRALRRRRRQRHFQRHHAIRFGHRTTPVESFDGNDLPATYTLSAWIKTGSGAQQRIISEQGNQFWGFGVNGTAACASSTPAISTEPSATSEIGPSPTPPSSTAPGTRSTSCASTASRNASTTTAISSAPSPPPARIPSPATRTSSRSSSGNTTAATTSTSTGRSTRSAYWKRRSPTRTSISSTTAAISTNTRERRTPAQASATCCGGLPRKRHERDTGVATTYTPSETITQATELYTLSNPPGRPTLIFEAQNVETDQQHIVDFVHRHDRHDPAHSAADFGGAPTGINSVSWSWTAPATFCQPPGSGLPRRSSTTSTTPSPAR